MFVIIFFVGGLIIGSFLNVVVYRLHLAETIMGRSYCPHCRTKILWYDNIPLLSFVLLKARCRDCKKPISWQYPMVEFLTGTVFALTASIFLGSCLHSFYQTGFLLVIFSLLMILLMYDIRFMEVPMIIFWITLIMVVSYKVLVENNLIMSSFGGAIIAMAFFWILVFISKEKWMGWGDVYVGFLSGFLLGWPNIFLGLFLSFFIGAICAIILLFGDKNMKSQIPFVPFLVVGTILTIFLVKIYPDIINYFWLQ